MTKLCTYFQHITNTLKKRYFYIKAYINSIINSLSFICVVWQIGSLRLALMYDFLWICEYFTLGAHLFHILMFFTCWVLNIVVDIPIFFLASRWIPHMCRHSGPSVKTFRSLVQFQSWRCCVLNGGIQSRALSFYHIEEIKLIHSLEWEPIAFLFL